MTDILWRLWWGSFAAGEPPETRRNVMRAMLLAGQSTPAFDCSGVYRIGLRRWSIA